MFTRIDATTATARAGNRQFELFELGTLVACHWGRAHVWGIHVRPSDAELLAQAEGRIRAFPRYIVRPQAAWYGWDIVRLADWEVIGHAENLADAVWPIPVDLIASGF